jgi:hypothetical protein
MTFFLQTFDSKLTTLDAGIALMGYPTNLLRSAK